MKWGLCLGSTLMRRQSRHFVYKRSKDKDSLRVRPVGRFVKIKRFEQQWGPGRTISRHDNDLICQVGVLRDRKRQENIDLMEELLGCSHLCLKNDRSSPCAVRIWCSGLQKCCSLNTAETEHPCLVCFPRRSSYGICGDLWVSLKNGPIRSKAIKIFVSCPNRLVSAVLWNSLPTYRGAQLLSSDPKFVHYTVPMISSYSTGSVTFDGLAEFVQYTQPEPTRSCDMGHTQF